MCVVFQSSTKVPRTHDPLPARIESGVERRGRVDSMASNEGGTSTAEEKTATRKRGRSNEPEEDAGSSAMSDPTHVPKKQSLSEVTVDRIALLDAGSQFGKVIDRRVRELKVECILYPLEVAAANLKDKGYKALIISGSPNGVNSSSSLAYDPDLFALGLPVLGICYGLQLINKHFGGVVSTKSIREDGQFTIDVNTNSPIFSGLEPKQDVLLTHGDSIEELADELEIVAMSGNLIAAIQHKTEPIFGLQFHPEVDLTVHGRDILKNFLYDVAKCTGNFSLENRELSCIQYIRSKVGNCKVLSLVSGGVDSTVCTALLNAALGPEKVIALHIDNGFMRKDESKTVKSSLEALGLRPHIYNCSLQFYTSAVVVSSYDQEGILHQHVTAPLHAVTSPEEKRKIIGDTFIKVANEAMMELNLQTSQVFLAQGTLRPDLIESASRMVSGHAQVIKTHHNDTELVRELRDMGRVVEPLADFHKDEVRALGEALGLPSSIIKRHPFPGPGLAIRVICQSEAFLQPDFNTTNSILTLLAGFSQACHASSPGIKELLQLLTAEDQETLYRISSVQPLFATLLPIHTVGVQGDGRTYNYVAALSSSQPEVHWESVMELAKLIPRICHNINRVAWVFGAPVYGPIEDITPTYLTRGVLDTLRECDAIANSILAKHDAQDCVSQMPVVLLPVHFDRDPHQRPPVPSCQRSVAIRTFVTSDFMTGIPVTPGHQLSLEVLYEMVQAMNGVSGISRVLYDLTPKPPGTTEWE